MIQPSLTPIAAPLPLPSVMPSPSLFGSLQVEPEGSLSVLRRQKDERFGFGYTLNPYRGCAHACRYCYVREYPNRMQGHSGLHAPEQWGQWCAPKLNVAEQLFRERHRLHNQTLFLGSATDPYQALERQYRLTRACLDVLLKCSSTRVMVHTRSPLILDDLELLSSFGPRLTVGFSIPTDDDTLRQVVEPKAPPIPSRWAAIERLSARGIQVHLAVTPLMVMVDPEAFARRAVQSGVKSAWVGALRLLDNDPFYQVLIENNWLQALDETYQEEVRQALRQAMPAPGKYTPRRNHLRPTPPRHPSWAGHPSLFDA